MGVPAFYRWLSEKYPKIVVDMLEDRTVRVEGTEIPLDLTAENPNGIEHRVPKDVGNDGRQTLEFDNLYIDMNGIIHPCSHPEDKPAPKSEEEMYKNIMDYVDRLFSAVRPRRLLYLAIDGVAPRAKMNQQRSRRFRSAQEAEEAADLMEEIRQSMKESGLKVPPKSKPAWDSNIITPGTKFMHKLSRYLRFYVQERVNRDKAWQNIKVILSDASEPGEGEHKIMDFVRRQRTQPGYDPNQHHILHGLDADLIMLGLATHERSFTILREQVLFGRKQKEASERKAAAMNAARDAIAGVGQKAKRGEHGEHDGDVSPHKPLQMLQLWVLREYLENEFRVLEDPGKVPFGYDFERVVDDFVFLCFFVGNDFLPHLPSLDIRDGAVDYLFNVYKRVISSLGDYLTSNGGIVNLKQVDVIMSEVGEIEDEVFKRRKSAEAKDQARRSSYGGGRGGRGRGGHANGRGGGGRGRGGGFPDGSSTGGVSEGQQRMYPPVESATQRRKATAHAKKVAKHSDDAIKTLAVPIHSVKTDRLKDAKRKLEDGGKRGAAWGGGDGDAGTGDTGEGKGVVGAAAESANKSAAAKLREKLGGKKARGKRGNRKAGGVSAETEEEGTGEAQPPPQKLPRVDAMAVDEAEEKEEEWKEEGAEKSDPLEGNAEQDEDNEGGDKEGDAANGVEETEEGGGDEEEGEGEDSEDEPEEDDSGLTEEEIGAAKTALKEKVKDQSQVLLDKARESVDDKVRLWEDGWKDRYYADKCKLEDIQDGGGREKLFQTYVEGLCWVMLYYYQGCPSWTWYFPFHYAPFASDLINCDRFEMEFDQSEPFRPMEQLMGVLPAASCKALPVPCRKLMTESESPIIDFYPKNVPCDPNGKPMPWLWVVLLPFIDEERLLSNLRPLYAKFTEEEKRRNSFGPSYLFANVRTSLGKALEAFLSGEAEGIEGLTAEGPDLAEGEVVLGSEVWGGFGGKLALPPAGVGAPVGATLDAPEQPRGVFENLSNNQVAVTVYGMPPKSAHVCRMLAGVELLPRTLNAHDLANRRPPRLNRNMSIAEMGSTKYTPGESGRHGGPGHRMIRHQLGGSSGAYHGQPQAGGYGQGYGYQQQQLHGFQGGSYASRGPESMHHMHQPTGNRRWGSQEPTPKRQGGRGRGRQQRHNRHPSRPQQQQQQQQQQQYSHHAPPVQAYYAQGVAPAAPTYYPQQPQYYQQPQQQQQQPQQQQQQPPQLQPPPAAPTAYYAAPPQQPPPQAPHSFQHPGFAAPPQAPPSGAAGFPTMDSLRSKLANALLQTKAPVPAAPQGGYYAYPPQGAPAAAPQQYYAAQQPVAVQPTGAPPAAASPYPNQHVRFDDQGKPMWGSQPPR